MGLFSSKKKIVVNTTVQPIFDSMSLPNSVRTGMMEYMLEESKMVPAIGDNFQTGIGVKAMTGYTWAKRTNYHYGLPTSAVIAQDQAKPKVESLLKALFGSETLMTHYDMGPMNSAHYAWQASVMTQGYNITTNEMTTLSASKDTPVYLADILCRYTEDTFNFLSNTGNLADLTPFGVLANRGPRPSKPLGDPSAQATPYTVEDTPTQTSNTAQVVFEYMGTSGAVKSLLHFDGEEPGPLLLDDGGITWSGGIGVIPESDVFKFGTSSAGITPPGVLTSQANAAFNLTGDFTVDCWIRLDVVQDQGVWMIGNPVSNSNRIQLFINQDGSLNFIGQAAGSTVRWDTSSAPGVFPWNEQVHVAVSRYGDWVVIHVNGNAVARSRVTGTVTTNQIMNLGVARKNGVSVSLHGYVDEFRVTHGSRWISNFDVPTSTGTISETPILQGHLDITISPGNEDVDFHQARAIKPDGVPTYFSYQHGSGTYPDIDGTFDFDVSESGRYLPWIYFRYDFQSLATTANENTKAYKDSAKWCKFLGMDYQSMADAIYEDPGLDDVIQAMVINGVRANGSSPAEREYLFKYFDFLWSAAQEFGTSVRKAQVIKDRRFTMTFKFDEISKTTHTGSIAAKGKYAAPNISGSTAIYRHQVTDTTYTQITISGMNLRYQILGQYGHVATPGSKEMMVPMDRAVLKEICIRRREDLIARSMHIMTNTYVEIETKWYQSGWFKIVLIIIAIVITIISFGGLGGIAASLVAFAAGTVAAMAIALATMLIKMVLVQVAVKLFIDVAGLQNSVIAAVLMIVASQFVPAGANQAMITEALLAAGNNMVKQAGTGYGKELESIQEEMKGFSADSKDQWEVLQDKRAEEFGWSDGVKADYLTLAPKLLFGESPDSFFTRTSHITNPGPYMIVSLHDFVDQKMRLPEFTDTLGDGLSLEAPLPATV